PTPGRASVPTRRSSDLVAVADRLLELDDHFPGPVGAPAPLGDAGGGTTVDVVGMERKPVADEVDDDRERGEKCKNADRSTHLPSLGVGPSRVNDAHAMYQEKRQAGAGGKHCESEERPRLGQPARQVRREGSGDESDRVDEGVSQDRREQRSGAYAQDAESDAEREREGGAIEVPVDEREQRRRGDDRARTAQGGQQGGQDDSAQEK